MQQQTKLRMLSKLELVKKAFCSTDKQVVCIDCILSDSHRSHEIAAIQKAVDSEKEILRLKINQSHEIMLAIED